MGMDVYGDKPTKKVGEYFRNNVWWWRPLWNYCLEMHPDIAGKVKDGHSNSGDGLNAEDALKLGMLLRQDVDSGFVNKYAQEYKQYVDNLPLESCYICNGSGSLKITAVQNLVDSLLVSSKTQESTQSQEKKCGKCDGSGKSESWMKSYPFSVDNVREFSEFCIYSGGFSIC